MSLITEQWEENEELKKVLRALIADIEAMRGNTGSPSAKDDFGPFEQWWGDNDNQIWITWPNLSILLEQAKKVMKE